MISCLLALTIFTSLANAQELPNEADLQAAYCIAIIDNDLTYLSAFIPDQLAYEQKYFHQKLYHPEIDESIIKAIDDSKFKLHRLKAYLTPRLQYLDLDGLMVAKNRAVEDISRKDKEIFNCLDSCQDPSCNDKCDNKKVRSCEYKCSSENETLNRIQTKCNGLTFLPY